MALTIQKVQKVQHSIGEKFTFYKTEDGRFQIYVEGVNTWEGTRAEFKEIAHEMFSMTEEF